MSLTGARHTYLMLKRAGTKGVHSRKIIVAKFPGCTNPSERLREVADHVEVRKRREHVGGSPGIRAWLAEFAPPDSEPVTPAHGPERGGDSVQPASLSVEPAPADTTEPVAIFRDGDGFVEALVVDVTGEPVEGAETLPFGAQVYRRAA